MTAWRVATFNIRHGLGPDGRVDLARTAREIAALDADVIGLQEVDVAFGSRSDHIDQATRLGELLGMQVGFGAALDLPTVHAGAPRRRYGVALLTGHAILAQQMHLLPSHPAGDPPAEPRGVLRARLRHRDGEELEVLVTHLDARSREHRTAQVQGLVRQSRGIDGAAVLMGDMNAAPSAPELAALPATGWRDVAQHVEITRGQRTVPRRDRLAAASLLRTAPAAFRRVILSLCEIAGLRRGASGPATHPARFPRRRIDLLWVRGDIAVSSLEVGPRGSSDHLPVVAALRVGR